MMSRVNGHRRVQRGRLQFITEYERGPIDVRTRRGYTKEFPANRAGDAGPATTAFVDTTFTPDVIVLNSARGVRTPEDAMNVLSHEAVHSARARIGERGDPLDQEYHRAASHYLRTHPGEYVVSSVKFLTRSGMTSRKYRRGDPSKVETVD